MPLPDAFVDLLFADQTLDEMCATIVRPETPSGSWIDALFDARAARDAGDPGRAVALLTGAADEPGLEARSVLWLWGARRALGDAPSPDAADTVLGAVVEVALPDGPELLAAYADGSARYVNRTGAATVWDAPDASSRPLTDAVLEATTAAIGAFGPPGPRTHEPVMEVRLTALTPAGCRQTDCPLPPPAGDPRGPLFGAATALLTFLVDVTLRAQAGGGQTGDGD